MPEYPKSNIGTEYFYPGAAYPLQSEYGELATGYNVSAGSIGLTTDARTANQIQEVSKRLSTGAKVLEIGSISSEVFESIPEQHFKELNRLSKLSGAELTMHAPLVEASGFDQNLRWSETNREMAERQMINAIERAHDLNPQGNIPVTFHSSAGVPEAVMKTKKEQEETQQVLVVDPYIGKVEAIKAKEKVFPEVKKFDAIEEVKNTNQEIWATELERMGRSLVEGENLIDIGIAEGMGRRRHLESMGLVSPDEPEDIDRTRGEEVMLKAYQLAKTRKEDVERLGDVEQSMVKRVEGRFDNAKLDLMATYHNLKNLIERVYPEATEEDKSKINGFAKKFTGQFKGDVRTELDEHPEKLIKFSELVEEGVRVLDSVKKPQLFQPLNQFLVEKSGKTFGDVAFHGYKKWKDNAPIVSIENPPVGAALSKGEDLRNLVKEARGQFVKRAKAEGIGEDEAKKAAEKLIGATWDVGHINMMRKYGYDKVDIVKETEKIAPFVKHVHLSDNFGLEHTELPMGMGTVPIKEMMKKLEAEGVNPKKIVEAINWYQHFKTVPIKETMAALGSPIYSMKGPPYWSQVNKMYGEYFAGYGTIFPEEHSSMYGSGFSTLPTELGGQTQKRGSGFSGTPME